MATLDRPSSTPTTPGATSNRPARSDRSRDAAGAGRPEGSLRGDVIAKLTEINQLRSSMAAVMSMMLSVQFQELGLSPAELRRELLGDRESVFEVIVARAMARGELGPKTPPARVVSLPIDLLRNDLLLTLQPVPAETIVSIVDDAFLPLVRVSSGLTDG